MEKKKDIKFELSMANVDNIMAQEGKNLLCL